MVLLKKLNTGTLNIMTKIYFLTESNLKTDSRTLKEAKTLTDEGYAVTIITRRFSPKDESVVDYHGTKITAKFLGKYSSNSSKFYRILQYLAFQLRLLFGLFFYKYDVLHITYFYTGFLGFIISKIRRKKTIMDIFDFVPDTNTKSGFKRRILVKLNFFMIKYADATIICSDERRKQIEGSKPKLLDVIYNSPDDDEYEHKMTLTDYRNYKKSDKKFFEIVYIGGLTPYRFLPELISIVLNSSNLKLTIGGNGYYQSLIEQVSAKNSRINYLGTVPYDQVEKYEINADIMVALYDPIIPNHKYASPNKFFEAMKLGKPLVMLDNTGMSNILKENKIGIVSDASESELSNSIQSLISMLPTYTSKSDKMRDIYESKFDWSIMQKRLTKLYDKILNEKFH